MIDIEYVSSFEIPDLPEWIRQEVLTQLMSFPETFNVVFTQYASYAASLNHLLRKTLGGREGMTERPGYRWSFNGQPVLQIFPYGSSAALGLRVDGLALITSLSDALVRDRYYWPLVPAMLVSGGRLKVVSPFTAEYNRTGKISALLNHGD